MAFHIAVVLTTFGAARTSSGQRNAHTPLVGGDVFSSSGVDPCETPARGPDCPRARWGWGDCPDRSGACDWCYGRRGIFAYVRRTNRTYKLSSGCDSLLTQAPGDVFWSAGTPDLADAFASQGADCVDVPRLGLVCQLPDGGGGAPRPRPTASSGTSSRPQPRPSPTPRPRPTDSSRCDDLAARIQAGWQSVASGVQYVAVPNGGRALHAFKVSRPVRIVYDHEGVTLPSLVRGARGIVGGITGTYSASPTRPPYVSGPVVLDGTMAAPPATEINLFRHVPRSLLGQRLDGTWVVSDLAAFGQNVPRPAAWRQLKNMSEAVATRQGLGGLGRLVENGRDVRQSTAIATQGFDGAQAGTGRNARAVAGVMRDRRTFLFLVQSGDGALGQGEGVDVLTCVLIRLGAADGVLLDGGGSAHAFLRKPSAQPRGLPIEIDSRAGQGGARALPTWILF